MYLKTFWIKNIWDKERYWWNFHDKNNNIKRWSILDTLEPSRQHLWFRLLSLCLGGTCQDISALTNEILKHRNQKNRPLCFGAELYPDLDKKSYGEKIIRIHCEVARDQKIRFFSNGFSGFHPLGNFAYGYNSVRVLSDRVQKDYLTDSRLRHTRFETFFGDNFPSIPVNDWLYYQYRNASRYNSTKAQNIYNISLSLITGLLPGLSFSHWDDTDTIYFCLDKKSYPVSQLPVDYIATIEFLIDFTRQMSDSVENGKDFNRCGGVLFIHQLEKAFPLQDNPGAIQILADVFPNLQFIFTCQQQHMVGCLKKMETMTVPSRVYTDKIKKWVITTVGRSKLINQYRNQFKKSRFPKSSPASEDTVVLIDVDSKIPNLALMKISRYYKKQGRKVVLTRDSAIHRKSKRVFASCVFRNHTTQSKISKLKRLHNENIEFGGSGMDAIKKLPDEIENIMPDYSLYPGVDFAMGFLTRGCSHGCSFCLVPKKEGALKQASTIDNIVPPGFKKMVLLDNNLLAYPGANDILKEMIKKNLQVNFNQTLDIRYLNTGNAELLMNVDSRNYSFSKPMYYFSLNSSALIPVVQEKIKLLKGIKRREITFICMYGYNTTLSDDIRRFSFLQRLGVVPFVQEFQPVDDSPVPEAENYFDTELDALLDIYYRFNGRNFEIFLKWVSRKYVEEFGELYMPLVDLIFKYNFKPYKHKYIETMAGTRDL
ncbi:MAG: hypothetical protein GTO45_04840 [Candidatus Aminicenantes bacterium]|nr:hypothetical protein [Candidatus Aminicenantes bacterium]NIM78077.1 hypothetical protein [Candidatus Aminicenantes bacterium]NIN17397.1 hypothetical protein [Candidatus Aminicenantes bacterium]NIN41290.1 hypothetical protein [Candidatus Aminicenantes bacterium]NIN84063.1 hypothetical protein [Candidatus Aminicenantes bacterium]